MAAESTTTQTLGVGVGVTHIKKRILPDPLAALRHHPKVNPLRRKKFRKFFLDFRKRLLSHPCSQIVGYFFSIVLDRGMLNTEYA